jgi:acetate kinase
VSLVLVLNCGSSSIKWAVIDPRKGESVRAGAVERIGVAGSKVPDHGRALADILDELGDTRVEAVGHRVVHGGTIFDGPAIVTPDVEAQIRHLSSLAPLHNPANLEGIAAARAWLPDVAQVAVFDTAFHRSIPAAAFTYALDREIASAHGIRRFGFHGISYQFVSVAAASALGRPVNELKLIIFHLGNGASACAIEGGRSVDTSMGMTPVEGLVMGTRAGDIDPGALVHLLRAGLSVDDLDDAINRTAGLVGLAGTADYRDVQSAAESGDPAASLALEVMHHRLRHYAGAYLAQLGGADAIVFTGGIGANSPRVRENTLATLGPFGVAVDRDANDANAPVISMPGSAVTVLVIPTNEELEIARQTASVLGM